MGKTFENLTWDDLCDLMCGGPEPEPEDDELEGYTKVDDFEEDKDAEGHNSESIREELPKGFIW